METHPAFAAWKRISPRADTPATIELLKKRNKSKVFRLGGVGADQLAVIAKVGASKTLRTERAIYEEILPGCDIPAPRYFGVVDNEKDGTCWLFMEDVTGETYDATKPEHRMAAMQWLITLHSVSLSEDKASLLPERTAASYYSHLGAARLLIGDNTRNSKLSNDDVQVLEDVLAMFDFVYEKWEFIQSACSELPQSLIHGDFSPQNFSMRQLENGLTLMAYDWELGGWGSPVIDFGCLTYTFGAEELALYGSMLDAPTTVLFDAGISHLVSIGRVLRLITFIHWASFDLQYEWPGKAMGKMRIYRENLLDVFSALDWR